jgi:peroxiredoxin Q/BCP
MSNLIGIRPLRWLICIFAFTLTDRLSADDEYQKTIYFRVGDVAPVFSSRDDEGNIWNSKDHVGKQTVAVYFYWGDFMPNCTKEALAFRNEMYQLRSEGIDVVGVSGDSVATHRWFKKENRLNFTLLADQTGDVATTLGVGLSGGGIMRIKDSKGNVVAVERGVTASRWVFVIGKDGTILHKDTNCDPATCAKKVLEAVVKQKRTDK